MQFSTLSESARFRLFFLALFVFIGYQIVDAQGDTFTFDANHHSDYSMCISYHVGNHPVCVIDEDSWDINVTQNTPIPNAGTFYISVNTTQANGYLCGNVGPSFSHTVYGWSNHHAFGPCIEIGEVTSFVATTDALYPPHNVKATDGDFDTQIVLTWDKGTDLPDNLVTYAIYRNNSLLTSVLGTARSYADTNLMPGQSYNYAIFTHTTSYGDIYSLSGDDQGSTFSVGLEASDGAFYNKTKLKWHDLSKIATDIRVERSVPGSMVHEELAILNKNATTYTDLDGIAGYIYTYYVTPIDTSNTFLTGSDSGYSIPNGKINGHVLSSQGAGVDSVNIYVQLVSNIQGGPGVPGGCSATYCTMTDVSGYYEIPDVYYYTGADFKIYAKKGSVLPHEITPDTLERTLDENSKIASFVDFTDLTVLTVGGRVTYPVGPGSIEGCGVKGVSILIGGKDIGIVTDANGDWVTSLGNTGTYTFKAKLLDHVFENDNGVDSTTLFINADQEFIDFNDVTVRTIHVVAQGGCQSHLGDAVEIRIAAPGGCFDTTYLTDASGNLTIDDLQARDYTVEVTDIINGGSNTQNILQQLNQEVEIDLTKLDTMTVITEEETLQLIPADTTFLPNGTLIIHPEHYVEVHFQDTMYTTEPSIRFIYRWPIEVVVDFKDAGADTVKCGSEHLIIMDQKEEYLLQFNVREIVGDCYIDTGTLVIYDEISDKEGVGQEVKISNGIAFYKVVPGNPDLATSAQHNHQKFLYIVPEIDFADVDPVTYWVLVTGIKSNAPSFITRTPEIPQLVIHDPPGDNSFAFIEKGTSFTTTSSTTIQVGGEGGVFFNLKAGPAVKLFAAELKAGGLLEFSAKAGRDNFNNDVTVNTITFLDNFSTSTAETFVGHDGDVYIGSALNQTFALSQELTFNQGNCTTHIDTVVEMGFKDFATTFIYTEHHIKNVLLPNLEVLKSVTDTSTQDGKKEYNRLLADILKWNQILAKNNRQRDSSATFVENLSISAGADVSKSMSSEHGVTNNFTYNTFFEASLKVGAFAELEAPGFYLETSGGVMGTFRWSQEEVRDTNDVVTRTTGYTISDNDIGDFISFDVLKDTVYDVPSFRVVSGTTSCPHEPNTAPRELPDIGVFPPIVNNVPPDEAALFVLDITNMSGSGETRQYAIKVVSNTNPDGAIVNVAGSDINTFPVQYYFDANQTLNLAMTVYKGPLASNYDSIGVEIYSECEYAIWGDGGNQTKSDTVWFSVNFLSECTNVSMFLPNDGWLVNQASNDILHTAFTGYDINNELFESITLQMKRDGYGYTNQVTIPKADLIGPFYDYFLDVSNFVDGNYTLRARANCGLDGGYTYSSEVTGIIDRTSLAPFGIPTPSDGFLREGQEVSVTFDKNLDCAFNTYPTEMSLVREDTHDSIPFTTSCFGNKIIINTTPPLIDRLDLEGVLVTARVHMLQDDNGNVQEYPTQWSFLVNVNPVFWDPELLEASGYEGQSHIIKGVLKNTSLLSKGYSLDTLDGPNIIEYPDWLTPLQQRGTVLPQNDYTVEFAVDPNLLPGLYTGTVTAMVDSLPVSMDVTFEMLARPVYWPFDPTQFQYTMNVVADFSLDNTNTNLSTDTRDMVAAFVNGQVRGITNIEYIPALNVYRAFLTVYSNNQGGGGAETVRFRFWHALNGVEYGAVETRTFTLDVNYGTVEAPLILHPEGFFQVIPLNKGWTWISLNVATLDMSREHIFLNILNSSANNIITVKSKTQTSTFTPPSGWNGNLTTLQLGQGYLVNLSNAPDTLRVVGFPPNTNTNVPVVNSWNWIGYPKLAPEPVNDILQDLTPAQGNILKSQSEFSTYNTTLHSWIGNLNEFTPGEGYKLFLSSGGTIIFHPSRNDDYQFNPYLYEYNMNVTGFADLSAIGEHDEGEMIIGAFIEGECRGTGTLEYVESAGEFRTFMLVNGNVADLGKQIEFRIKNDITGTEYSTNGLQLTFVADGLIGTVPDPYLFFGTTTGLVDGDHEGYELKQSRPNPTGGLTSISFTMPRSEHVLLRLYDLNGELVKVIADAVMNEGVHSIATDLTSLTGGVYYYEMRTENFVGVKKLVRQ